MPSTRELTWKLLLCCFVASVQSKCPDPCQLNEELLNRRNIRAERRLISQCNNKRRVHCEGMEKSMFRTIDGRCNNLKYPNWGRSFSCLQRMLPGNFGDTKNHPRRSCTGNELPNPRRVSNVLHREMELKRVNFTTMFMEWGGIIAHDLSHNDLFRTKESHHNFPPKCCKQGPLVSDICMSQKVPPEDPFYPGVNVSCLDLVRTRPCRCSYKRQALNKNTPFYDLTLVYGNTDRVANSLRRFRDGKLLTSAGDMLPVTGVKELCVSPKGQPSCFRSGDIRTNQSPFLITLQTVLHRYHNFLCDGLKGVNPHWDDERLYQEARTLNIATEQMITYSNYLKKVLGPNVIEKTNVTVLTKDSYTIYDPDVDPWLFDEYTTVAARYGHTQAPNEISQIDPETGAESKIDLAEYFERPFDFPKGQYDLTAMGMTKDLKMEHDVLLGDSIRNHLYRRVYLHEDYGQDLVALTIMRGRDHGIPGYTHYLAHFFGYRVHCFDDLKKYIPENLVDILENLYESVHDVDLYSAGLAENHEEGAIVGPTFARILALQCKRIKYGDRYWFEHKYLPWSLTPDRLAEIRNTTLSRMLCETTKIRRIQEEVFLPPSETNPIVPCGNIHEFNFRLWKEDLGTSNE